MLLAAVCLFPQPRGHRGPWMGGRGIGIHRPNALDRWNKMTPAERQRALEKLPPERRKTIEERIERFNQLPQEEQDRLRERYERFRQLPPEKQDQVRRQLKHFHALPDQRRSAIRKEFEQLRGLPAAERETRLNSEEFRDQFNPEEQKLIRDLSDIMPEADR